MAEQISAEDLTEFLDSLRRTVERIAAVYHASDLVCFEICERRLKEQIKNTYRHITVPEFLVRRSV